MLNRALLYLFAGVTLAGCVVPHSRIQPKQIRETVRWFQITPVITLETEPPGASIYLEDKYMGTSGLRFETTTLWMEYHFNRNWWQGGRCLGEALPVKLWLVHTRRYGSDTIFEKLRVKLVKEGYHFEEFDISVFDIVGAFEKANEGNHLKFWRNEGDEIINNKISINKLIVLTKARKGNS